MFFILLIIVFSKEYISGIDGDNEKISVDIIKKVLNIMNDNSEIVKLQHLDEASKLISHPLFYDIKKSFTKPLNFYKKTVYKISQMKLQKLYNLKSNEYEINIDIENNQIILSNKKTEHLICFADSGKIKNEKFNDSYISLVKAINPSYIFIDDNLTNYSKESFSYTNQDQVHIYLTIKLE